jgi:hypothetical protein
MDEKFFCHDVRCQAFNGFEVPWIPGTEYEPGEWATTTCPYCDEPLYETYIDTDELKLVIEKLFAEEIEPLSNLDFDVDVVRLTEVILAEIRSQSTNAYAESIKANSGDDWFTDFDSLSAVSYRTDEVGDEHE